MGDFASGVSQVQALCSGQVHVSLHLYKQAEEQGSIKIMTKEEEIIWRQLE